MRILKQSDIRRPKTAEIKFMRCTAGFILSDERRNEDILEVLNVDPIKKKLAQYKQEWLICVSRI